MRWRVVGVCSWVGQCRLLVCDPRHSINLNACLNIVHCSSFASSKAELSASSHTFVHLQLLNISKTCCASPVIRPGPSSSYPCRNRHFTQNCQYHKAPGHGKPPSDLSRRPTGVAGRCEYTELEVADGRQRVIPWIFMGTYTKSQ